MIGCPLLSGLFFQREGPGSEPGNSLSIPAKLRAVFCVRCLRDGPVSSELIREVLLAFSGFRVPGRKAGKQALRSPGRALPALRAAVAQLCRHGPGPMHHSNAQEAWLALVQGARRPPPARSFRPSNDQGDLLESTLPAEVEAAMKPPRVMYRAAATGLDRAHDAGLGGSC